MKIKSTLTAAVAAVIMTGAAASAAQATSYDLTGGDYVGAADAGHTFSVQESYPIHCASVSYAGNTDNVPGAPASTDVTPEFSGCDFLGIYPVEATTPDPWRLTVTGGSFPGFGLSLGTPGATVAEFEIPLFGCRITYKFPDVQSESIVTALSDAAETRWYATLRDLHWETNGFCPQGWAGSGGMLDTNAEVTFPDVSIDEL
jgi:hypothetical protein